MSVPLPRVLCRGWQSSTGVHIRCVSPVIHTGEPGGRVIEDGICSLCLALGKRAAEMKLVREARRVERLAATGGLVAKVPEDVWKGFRE